MINIDLVKENLAIKIQTQRLSLGLSKHRLAELANVDERTIRRLETADPNNTTSLSSLIALANALNIPLSQLFTLQRKPIVFMYEPNVHVSYEELSRYIWHVDPPSQTMSIRRFLSNGEIYCYASWGYWEHQGIIEPIEMTEEAWLAKVRTFLPNIKSPRELYLSTTGGK